VNGSYLTKPFKFFCYNLLLQRVYNTFRLCQVSILFTWNIGLFSLRININNGSTCYNLFQSYEVDHLILENAADFS